MGSNMLKVKAYHTEGSERERTILAHLPQIKYIAQRIAVRLPPDVQLDDLISAGILGLLDAVEKFDKSKGVQFKTYAEVRIRGAILDSLRDLDWAPRSLRKRSKEVEEAYVRLEQRLGRSASDSEVADELNIDIASFHTLLDQLKSLNIGHFKVGRNDHENADADDLPLRYVSAQEEESPFNICLKSELRQLLARLVEQLPEREQLVVALYYYEELTMREIGQILGVNESRVCQLHTRAMLRLRGKMQRILKK
jgi:RNA polymerase sigma factor FliA